MGHALGDQAGNAVKKSEKKEAMKNRTDAEIFHGIDRLLHDGLSVPPLDIRLLLTRYNELLEKALAAAAEELGKRAGDYSNFVFTSSIDNPERPPDVIEKYQKAAEEDSGKDEMVSEGGPNG
jgi:hypothetical protein